jgi:hypothetical protein
VFGALSDKIGRKPIIMLGCLLAVLTYFPLFKGIAQYANPVLHAAQTRSPVVLAADPADCSFQFNPTGTAKFTNSCDIAKATLTSLSVNYAHENLAPGSLARVKIGDKSTESYDPKKLTPDDAKTRSETFKKDITEGVRAAGYPAKADPGQVNHAAVVGLLTILVIYVTMVYGPIAAMLVELFPTRIRYSSMSLPYHIGNGWFGGFLPATSFAIVAATGDIYSGLWYPIGVAAMTFVIGMLFIKETMNVDIHDADLRHAPVRGL